MFTRPLQELLKDEHVGGFRTQDYHKVRWRTYGASLELAIAASLARCGAASGYLMLADYLEDIHYIFKKFAASELVALTAADFAFDADKWRDYIKDQRFPRPAVRLQEVDEA
jgi:hypothetical protein